MATSTTARASELAEEAYGPSRVVVYSTDRKPGEQWLTPTRYIAYVTSLTTGIIIASATGASAEQASLHLCFIMSEHRRPITSGPWAIR